MILHKDIIALQQLPPCPISNMTFAGSKSPTRRTFLGFRRKSKDHSPKQSLSQISDLASHYADVSPHIPKQAHNPAVHPLLVKPVAREENFVLLPHGDFPTEQYHLDSPIRSPASSKEHHLGPKKRHSGPSEWDQYLSAYAEVPMTS